MTEEATYEMEMGEYHWKDGRYFKRLDDGSVRIRTLAALGIAGDEMVIPPYQWASIIASVSKNGETPEQYRAAVALHGCK